MYCDTAGPQWPWPDQKRDRGPQKPRGKQGLFLEDPKWLHEEGALELGF